MTPGKWPQNRGPEIAKQKRKRDPSRIWITTKIGYETIANNSGQQLYRI